MNGKRFAKLRLLVDGASAVSVVGKGFPSPRCIMVLLRFTMQVANRDEACSHGCQLDPRQLEPLLVITTTRVRTMEKPGPARRYDAHYIRVCVFFWVYPGANGGGKSHKSTPDRQIVRFSPSHRGKQLASHNTMTSSLPKARSCRVQIQIRRITDVCPGGTFLERVNWCQRSSI